MSLPTTSKAVIQPDPKSNHLEATTLPTLTLPAQGTDYLIHVRGTSPCLGELTWEIAYPALFAARVDRVPGTEGSGVIIAAPSANSKFNPGDEVMFRLDAWLSGTLREYTLVPEENLAPKPKDFNWTEASATPLSSLTAWQGLFEHGILDADGKGNTGKRVLITGASGSVGNWALRFAANVGAHAIGVGSGSKADEMRAAGAADVIDYRNTKYADWADKNEKVDMVLDCTGRDLAEVWKTLKPGGVFLSVVANPADTQGEHEAAVAKWYLVQPRGSDLERISALAQTNGWKPIIDSVVPFDQFQAAYDKVDSGRTNGKVVITVSE